MTSEDRLAQEKKEREEKVREAERQDEDRERQRREKLEAEMALKGGKSATPAPASPPAPTPTDDGNTLLSAIQGGTRLRKTVTNDQSGTATSGKVVDDVAPPAHVTTRPPSPLATFTASPPAGPPVGQDVSFSHAKKKSVDRCDTLAVGADKQEVDRLPATAKEGEAGTHPVIQVSEHAESDLMADIDLSTEYRVRSLYSYSAQQHEDLDFDGSAIILAHPSKSGGDWWYGTTVQSGKTGFFPRTYVQEVEQLHATALYDYEGGSADELTFRVDETLVIVDRSEMDWWKAERDGIVFIVPATYVRVTEEYRVRSLYPYSAQRSEDLDFDTNMIIIARPSKLGDDWWHGTTVQDGKAGFLPRNYVKEVEQVHATALYDYEGTSADELTLREGDALVVVDRSDTNWWKVERGGVVFSVPAAYLEVVVDEY